MPLEFQSTEFPVFLVVGIFLLAVNFTRAGDQVFAAMENLLASLAARPGRAVLSAAIAVLLRVAMLPLMSIPFPQIHDEFSYLLAADTFAHGRLTNPPHPMWIYFDTFHVNQNPTYMSKYPPAQGAALALGQLLGNPWIGVLLSVAAMTAAIVWALQAWLPPSWALLGGVVGLWRVGLFGYWINGYMGGAVAALGGALVVGAFARILRSWRPADAVILGLGETILANSRPFEGLIFSIPVFAALLFAASRHEGVTGKEIRSRFVAPFASVMILCLAFMAYYNWRGTGSPFLFPYTLNDRAYLRATPALLWQKSMPPQRFENPQFESFYNGWAIKSWGMGRASSISKARQIFVKDVRLFVRYFVGMELYLPFLAVLLLLRNRRVAFFVGQIAFCFFGFLLVSWFQFHYAAPLVVTVLALIVAGLRYVRSWQFRNFPLGMGLSRAFVFSAIALAPFQPWEYQKVQKTSRAQVAEELAAKSGKQLVIVHYSPQHDPLGDWVYNSADIDDAKIVWAREIPGVALSPLLNYFRGYHVWIVDADDAAPRATQYTGQGLPTEVRVLPP
jgi:hypothetical protein